MLNTVKSRFLSGKTIILTIALYILSIQLSNAQWVQMNNGMGNRSVYSLAVNGNNIFAGTFGYGVYKSTDYGTSWVQTSLNYVSVNSLAANGNNIFAGTYNPSNGVFKSTDYGISWTQTSLNNLEISSLVVNGNDIFAATGYPNPGNGVYLSTNNGTSWTQTSLNNRVVFSLVISGNNIFAGTSGYGVYLSMDNGTTWTQTSLNSGSTYDIVVNGNNIFAGTSAGVYLSTNNGTNWTQTASPQNVMSLAIDGYNIFAGTNNSGIYVSNNNGTNWTQRNEGLGNGLVNALGILNNYIFTGIATGGSVYRRQLGELTGISLVSNELPNNFSLSQNYPNPFNPSTKIKFALPNSGFSKLVVYDALGRVVETLVNEQLNAGTYETVWSADKYSSGVYFYKLVVGDNTNNGGFNFSQTNRMLMIK